MSLVTSIQTFQQFDQTINGTGQDQNSASFEMQEFTAYLTSLAFKLHQQPEGSLSKTRAAKWLFTKKDQHIVTSFWVWAKQLGLISESEGLVRFNEPALQTELTEHYFLSEPFSLKLLSGTINSSFGVFWQVRAVREPAIVEQLIEWLQTYLYSTVRQEAATALGLTCDTRAIEPLIEALRDENPKVCEAASDALVALAYSPLLMPALQNKLNQFNWSRRHWIIRTLARIDNPQVSEIVRAALTDKNLEVREWATVALGRVGDEADITNLMQILFTKEGFLGHSASQALITLSHRSAIAREQIIKTLANIVRNPIDEYHTNLAARLLGELDDPHAIEPLLSVFSRPESSQTSFIAIKSLSKLNEGRITPDLINKILHDCDISIEVAEIIKGAFRNIADSQDAFEILRQYTKNK